MRADVRVGTAFRFTILPEAGAGAGVLMGEGFLAVVVVAERLTFMFAFLVTLLVPGKVESRPGELDVCCGWSLVVVALSVPLLRTGNVASDAAWEPDCFFQVRDGDDDGDGDG